MDLCNRLSIENTLFDTNINYFNGSEVLDGLQPLSQPKHNYIGQCDLNLIHKCHHRLRYHRRPGKGNIFHCFLVSIALS